jgi:hypothetical protein
MEGVRLSISAVIAGHSCSTNGVASLAYDPAIHHFENSFQEDGCPDQVRA